MNTIGIGDAAICTSMILSEWQVIDVIIGLSHGAITTPTPDAGLGLEENMNLYPSIMYEVLSVRCVSERNRIGV